LRSVLKMLLLSPPPPRCACKSEHKADTITVTGQRMKSTPQNAKGPQADHR